MVVEIDVAAVDRAHVAAVRAFTRSYTRVIDVLQEGLLRSPYTLAEARVLFELAHRTPVEVSEVRGVLGLDGGYLSRMLARFEADGLLTRRPSPDDARRQVVVLTDQGGRVARMLEDRSDEQVRRLLAGLDDADQGRLTGAMEAIRSLLAERAGGVRAEAPAVLRPPGPGDYGWVVQRHGALYAAEYGWDETFEALVARIVADYVERRNPSREAAWIAELDGVPVGCVFCVRADDDTAQLRILLVEPTARGRGIGALLVQECLRFARAAGYRRITLWTNDVLVPARRIYEAAGFELLDEEPHRSFGHDLVGQHWARDL